MTKKDYKLIAYNLRIARLECRTRGELAGIELAKIFIASGLEIDNPRFNKQKFYDEISK